jgi:N-methyl-L-tryptophan oxidase
MESWDIIIAGAGAMGMSAGYHAASRGLRTLLLDADNPPHGSGTHHGETRIIRHAYGEGREYTPMALRAQSLWLDLEKETGSRLFLPTGFLQAGEPGSKLLSEMIAGAREHGLTVERLIGPEMRERWPGLALPPSMEGIYEKEGGVLLCEECIAAYREAALAKGALLKVNTAVSAIEPDAGGVTVLTESGERYRGRGMVLTAGKFAGPLLSGLGLGNPLAPVRRTVAWFQTETDRYDAERFPAFLFDLPEGSFYGFPSIDGSGVKVGGHDTAARPVDLGVKLPPFGAYPEDGNELSLYVEKYMTGVSPEVKRGSSCTYTMTPDEHFILDRHPEYPHLAIGAGFSGHGFKFSSVIGEILAGMAAGEEPDFDLSIFSLKRFAKTGA